MHRLRLGLFFLVAACGATNTSDGGAYRIEGASIYSNAAFDVARLNGHWDQVAAFAVGAQQECQAGGADFSTAQAGVAVTYQLCLSGRDLAGSGPLNVTGPGRFAVQGSDAIGEDWWILWVDESYRTLAIGSPSGTFGFILNRGKSLPADRLKAASEVFDFNGYDVGKLTAF